MTNKDGVTVTYNLVIVKRDKKKKKKKGEGGAIHCVCNKQTLCIIDQTNIAR